MRIDEAILIMENERPHCGDKLTFTEEERHEAYTLALMALRDVQRVYDEGYKQGRYDEKVETETPLQNGEQTHALRTETHACDLISRADAIDAIVNTVSDVGLHDNSETARYGATYRQQEILTILKSLPSAERPTGEWLCSDDSYENAVCSNCGFDSGESYVVVRYEQKWKACPMCEARMINTK